MEKVQRKKKILVVVALFAALVAVYCGVVSQNCACDPADNADWSAVLPLSGVLVVCLCTFEAENQYAAQGFAEPSVAWTASLRCYYGGLAGVENIIVRC